MSRKTSFGKETAVSTRVAKAQGKKEEAHRAFHSLAKTTTDSLKQVLQGVFARRSRYLLHGSVLALGVFLVTMNVYAKTNDEVVKAERNILAQLVFPEQDRYEVVSSDEARSTAPDTYVPSAIFVASAASADGSLTDDATVLAAAPVAYDETDPFAVPSIGRDTLVKSNPSETDVSFKPRRDIVNYKLKGGETITSVAAKFGVDAATILQENGKYADDIVKPGDTLRVLPFPGATDKVGSGETLSQIASAHGVSSETIMEDNGLFADDDIQAGQVLLVRGGKRDAYIGARPRPQVAQAAAPAASSGASTASSGASTASTGDGALGSSVTDGVVPPSVVQPRGSAGNRFPWGWCTWLVADLRGDVTWRGNAGQWLANARAQGRPTGRIPAVGAILVTNESWWGHVAYVEAVNGDQVSVVEMNYKGFGITSRRTISNGSPVIKGYVY